MANYVHVNAGGVALCGETTLHHSQLTAKVPEVDCIDCATGLINGALQTIAQCGAILVAAARNPASARLM